MPKRLVYSPRCYAFVKGPDNNITNISEYVVSGQVQRLISQASTAELTLRNPQRIFTTPTRKVYFHPMDPITIYMERLRGYPVQVFTGYLDDTPYYQLFPGTVTLQATCTLKRLIYTYFDPSLPYVNQWLAKFGWVNFFDGTARNYNALVNSPTTVKENNPLNDSSIGKLLWAILTDLGEWDDTNIWIEELPGGPNGIAARITKLYNSLIASEQSSAAEFDAFMQQMIGSGSFGSGGGNGGAGSSTNGGPDPVNDATIKNQQQWATAFLQALGVNTNSTNLQCIVGWEQAEANADIWGSGQADDPEQTHNPLNTTNTTGSTGTVGNNIAVYPDWNTGIQATVGTLQVSKYGYPAIVSALTSGNSTTQFVNAVASSGWGTSGALLAQTVAGTKITSVPTATDAVATTNSINETGSSSGSKSKPSNTASATGTITEAYVSPFPGGANGASIVANQRTDQGVDWDLGPIGSNVVAVGNGNVLGTALSGWPGPNAPNNFMWYQLTDGPNQGAIIYYAEGISPVVGTGKVAKGQTIAKVTDQYSGVEFGYSGNASGQTLAQANDEPNVGGDWDSPTDAGKRFARFMRALGLTTMDDPGTGPYTPNGNQSIVTTNGSASSGGGSGSSSGGGGGLSQQQVISDSSAAAFTTELNFPSIADITEAMLLGSEHKGLMHDQQLMPFVQQVAQASLREFMSLPNGDFYAFYPDYFGETAHRVPYWKIPDLEILDGAIYLNDSALVTHQFVVGDNTYPVDDALINALFSSAAITVYNAFLDPSAVSIDIDNSDQNLPKGMADVMSQAEAVNFVKRYGARPQVSNYPMVRSALYEMFLAYQQFLLSWSNQFRTPFTFTFMPELFPGGKVAFPDHGLQMYINSVTHTWDLAEAGFTTSAVLSAPAKMPGTNNPDLPPNMVQALVEPVRTTASLNPTTGKPKNKSTQDQSTSNQQSTPVRTPAPPPPPGVTITNTGTF